MICAWFCSADGLKDLLFDEHNNAIKTFLLDVCQLMKRLTQLPKKQKYGDAENGEPKAKIMMLLQICATYIQVRQRFLTGQIS